MEKIPLLHRLRKLPSGVLAPAENRRPFRLWMTGSLAVVMAAVMPVRDVSQAERSQLMRLLRHSQYGVNETVSRIEAMARDEGLPVLALLRGEHPVLVLTSRAGGTPVVMQHADSHPSMPLSVMISESRSGGADVLVASFAVAPATQGWADLPDAAVADLAALPSLVDRALT
jgi:uncharacterized protein (DUF302 family)